MRGDFLHCKVFLMIFLVITLSFTVMNLEQVSAEEESRVCCEFTNDEDACVYTTEDNCDERYGITSATCEQTAFCEVGTCVSELGQCSTNVAKGTCELAEYQWYDKPKEEVSMCTKGCCVIADYEASFTTESHCEYLISDLEDVELQWFDEITSEAECSAVVREADTGCCVSSSQCTYGTRGECENPDIVYDTGEGFFSGEICSDLGACGCEPRDYTACVDEDVYHFDSCGNQEGIAEDCDYLDNTWCENGDGDAFCADISCEEGTFDGKYYIDHNEPGSIGTEVERNTHDYRIGEDREHGESWCLYESPAGDFKDRPGSQHYRSYCYFGEEIIEPCEDFREEICIQFPYEQSEEATGSACIPNDAELFSPNITTVSVGANFWNENDDLGSQCAMANVECPQLWAVDAYADKKWEVGANIGCMGPEWARNMSLYCASLGDCGASANLVEQFTESAWRQVPSQEYIGGEPTENSTDGEGKYRKKTYVGYDSCVEGTDPDPQTGERYCVDKDLECLDSDENCPFIDSTSEIYEVSGDFEYDFNQDWINNYGARSGIIGLSETISELASEDGEIRSKLLWPIVGATLAATAAAISIGSFATAGSATLGGITASALAGTSTNMLIYSNAANSLGTYAVTSPGYFTYSGASFANGYTSTSTWVPGTTTQVPYSGEGVKALAEGGKLTAEQATAVTDAAKAETNFLSGANVLQNLVPIAIAVAVVAWQWSQVKNEDNPLVALEKAQQFEVSSYIGAGVSAAMWLGPYIFGSQAAAAAGTAASFGPWGALVAAVILLVAAINYSGGKTQDITIASYCEPWQPPTGSSYCELCDIAVSEGGLAIDDGEGNVLRGYDCTEYKCRSLGQGCEFISENVGSDRAKCVGVAANDVNHPVIEKYMVDVSEDMNDDGILDTDGYTTEPTAAYEFVADDYVLFKELVEPYQTVSFGIETDELSQCRISNGNPTDSFEDMDNAFPDSYYDYVHNQSWILVPDETYDFYIRCQDHNGNYNIDEFVFQMETTSGVDITTPIIETVSVNDGAYIAYDVTETAVSIFVNEPAQCKWDYEDVSYELMAETFLCSGIPSSATSLFDNECQTSLPVNASIPNSYYFACEDGAGNSNAENYGYNLQGTEQLGIDYTTPNGTIYYDFTELEVHTSVGAQDGVSTCYYDGVAFYQTNSSTHKQPLQDLDPATYEHYIECIDVAGNSANSTIEYVIDVDTTVPELTAVYLSGESIYYTLNEEATCEALYEEFEYGEGSSSSGTIAVTDITTYYLICQDIFGNEGTWEFEV